MEDTVFVVVMSIFLGVIFIFFVAGFLILGSDPSPMVKSERQLKEEKEAFEKKIEIIKTKFCETAGHQDIRSISYNVKDNYYLILVDPKGHKMKLCHIFRGYKDEQKTYEEDYLTTSIIGCEFLQTDAKTGGIKRIVVGSILAGGVGAIIGAFTKSSIVKDVKIVIYFSSALNPTRTLNLLPQTKYNSDEYKKAKSFADQVMSVVKAIVAQNSLHR
ncbi:hypothetical protein [uncultured Subdoligranulum sp.]|uniref:hypothetical protein n=1 Tax=uncultured Subdoligranulum sp. TaxID=512298 RepID=UPI00262A0C40|nr:hypothetical protein [uncultured Subdoligranulum sp.]